jgi:hypothetical protein
MGGGYRDAGLRNRADGKTSRRARPGSLSYPREPENAPLSFFVPLFSRNLSLLTSLVKLLVIGRATVAYAPLSVVSGASAQSPRTKLRREVGPTRPFKSTICPVITRPCGNTRGSAFLGWNSICIGCFDDPLWWLGEDRESLEFWIGPSRPVLRIEGLRSRPVQISCLHKK